MAEDLPEDLGVAPPKADELEAAVPPAKGRKTKKASPKNGGMSDLMKELWEAAVTLRGSIEPADYNHSMHLKL